jgi:hypothetical protein
MSDGSRVHLARVVVRATVARREGERPLSGRAIGDTASGCRVSGQRVSGQRVTGVTLDEHETTMDGQRSTKIRRGFAPLLSASLPSPRSIRGFDAFPMLLPRYSCC